MRASNKSKIRNDSRLNVRFYYSAHRVTDLAKFAVRILKDEAPMPMPTVALFFIFVLPSCIHLATLKIHSVSKTPPNFEQRTLPEVLRNCKNEAASLVRIPFLLASDGMVVWSVRLLAATRRSAVAQQENRAGGDRQSVVAQQENRAGGDTQSAVAQQENSGR